MNSDAAASEPQRLCLLHLGQRLDPAQHLGGDLAVDLDQRDGVGAGGIAAEMEGGDVDAGIAERGREPADQARLVLVGDVEHRRPELGIHADALDVDDPRPAVGEHRARHRPRLLLRHHRHGDEAFIVALAFPCGLLDRNAALLGDARRGDDVDVLQHRAQQAGDAAESRPLFMCATSPS